MAEATAVRLKLEQIELPPAPGSLITITVNDAGHGEFFGPEGPVPGWGYTLKVNDGRWRTVLETVTSVEGGSRATFRIEGRYEDDGSEAVVPFPRRLRPVTAAGERMEP